MSLKVDPKGILKVLVQLWKIPVVRYIAGALIDRAVDWILTHERKKQYASSSQIRKERKWKKME